MCFADSSSGSNLQRLATFSDSQPSATRNALVEFADFPNRFVVVDHARLRLNVAACEIEDPAVNVRPAAGPPSFLDDIGLAEVVDLLDHVQFDQSIEARRRFRS